MANVILTVLRVIMVEKVLVNVNYVGLSVTMEISVLITVLLESTEIISNVYNVKLNVDNAQHLILVVAVMMGSI